MTAKTTFGPQFFLDVGRDPDKWVAGLRVRLGTDTPSDEVLRDFFEAALAAPRPAQGAEAVREDTQVLRSLQQAILECRTTTDFLTVQKTVQAIAALDKPSPRDGGGTTEMSAEKLIERCSKPGCGALKILGKSCTVWDCPQHLVAADELQAAQAALSASQADNEQLRKALEEAGQAFEAIRVLLVNDLDEPGRTAFWRAVKERDAILAARSALPEQEEGK